MRSRLTISEPDTENSGTSGCNLKPAIHHTPPHGASPIAPWAAASPAGPFPHGTQRGGFDLGLLRAAIEACALAHHPRQSRAGALVQTSGFSLKLVGRG